MALSYSKNIKHCSHQHAVSLSRDQNQLIKWYHANKRMLPWRRPYKTVKKHPSPYAIWVSEIMLQQTTVQTVIPYYKKFLKRFPTLEKLAQANIQEVRSYWSGLGYYSRVHNLHKTAQIIIKQKGAFPKSYQSLLQLPGFGPYTARAVSSLAFDEKVGVLDANVIRVLARYFGRKGKWWQTSEKNKLQHLADQWASGIHKPSVMNQALMELGALICTAGPKPPCQKCPLRRGCQALQKNQIPSIPATKTKPIKQIWLWKVLIPIYKNKVGMLKNTTLPFLKGQLMFPGHARQRTNIPKTYQVRHSITRYNIYVQVCLWNKGVSTTPVLLSQQKQTQLVWLKIQDIKKQNPSSLLQKILHKIPLK